MAFNEGSKAEGKKNNSYVYSGIGIKNAIVAEDDKINEGYLGTVYKEVDVSDLEPIKIYDNKYYKISEDSIGYILEKIGYDKKDRKKTIEFKYRFMDTVKTENGAYMLNLGCIGDSKVDMVFTDCVGNSVSTDGKEL